MKLQGGNYEIYANREKQLLIYVIIAYGITYVMGLLMCGMAMEKVLISALFQMRRCCIQQQV